MKLLPHLGRIIGATLIAAVVFPCVSRAQFVLEVKSGTTWDDKLVLSNPATMSFRWKWDGRTELGGAVWQMTYTAPGTANPAIVKSVGVPAPTGRLSEYATFQILADAVPSNAPPTFYIRMRSGENYSSWIPVTITGTTRAVTTVAPPPAPIPAVQVADMPIWVKLTKIICKAVSDDGSASDEVYAVLGSVALNREKPWTSKVWTDATRLYPDINPGDLRATDQVLWGPPTGDPVVLKNPNDAIMLFALMEQDVGVPYLARAASLGQLSSTVEKFNPDWSYAQMRQAAENAFLNGVIAASSGSGTGSRDDRINVGSVSFMLTQAEIDEARAGKIVKKELLVGSGGHGVYVVRFQVGRLGMSTEPW